MKSKASYLKAVIIMEEAGGRPKDVLCAAEAMDIVDELEDMVGAVCFLAEKLESAGEGLEGCLAREANRIANAKLDNIAKLRLFIEASC